MHTIKVISHATNFEGKDQSPKFYETESTFEKKELIKRGGGGKRGRDLIIWSSIYLEAS